MSVSDIVVYTSVAASFTASALNLYVYYNLIQALKIIGIVTAKIDSLSIPKAQPLTLTATHTVSVASTDRICFTCGRRVAKFQIVDGNPVCDNCRNGNL